MREAESLPHLSRVRPRGASSARRCMRTFIAIPAPAPPQSVKMWRRPISSARSSSHYVCHVGARPAQHPPPHRVGMGTETPGGFRPRQPRLLLEPLQPKPLTKVVGEIVGLPCVVYALSRHDKAAFGAERMVGYSALGVGLFGPAVALRRCRRRPPGPRRSCRSPGSTSLRWSPNTRESRRSALRRCAAHRR